MSTSKSLTREPLNSRQRATLMAFYEQNPYPSASQRHQLAQTTGRTLKQIQDWFSNRRRNDSKLITGKTATLSTVPFLPPPPPPASIPPVYYYPPTTPMCPCCYFNPTAATPEQPFYPPCSTFYYSPCNTFH